MSSYTLPFNQSNRRICNIPLLAFNEMLYIAVAFVTSLSCRSIIVALININQFKKHRANIESIYVLRNIYFESNVPDFDRIFFI